MTIKIGISPIAWQNDDLPDLTKDFTMEQALKESREIGYTGVERGQRMPHDTDGLRAFLEKYDIGLCGGWCSGNLLNNTASEECDAVQQQVDQFKALNAPCIVFAECSNTVQGMIDVPVNDPIQGLLTDVYDTRISIQRFKRICRKNGLKIVKQDLYFINPNYEVLSSGVELKIVHEPAS